MEINKAMATPHLTDQFNSITCQKTTLQGMYAMQCASVYIPFPLVLIWCGSKPATIPNTTWRLLDFNACSFPVNIICLDQIQMPYCQSIVTHLALLNLNCTPGAKVSLLG